MIVDRHLNITRIIITNYDRLSHIFIYSDSHAVKCPDLELFRSSNVI